MFTQFRIIDRFLSPRGIVPTLEDARIALTGWPGGHIEAYSMDAMCWMTVRTPITEEEVDAQIRRELKDAGDMEDFSDF